MLFKENSYFIYLTKKIARFLKGSAVNMLSFGGKKMYILQLWAKSYIKSPTYFTIWLVICCGRHLISLVRSMSVLLVLPLNSPGWGMYLDWYCFIILELKKNVFILHDAEIFSQWDIEMFYQHTDYKSLEEVIG